jgi:putative oxidoreductase
MISQILIFLAIVVPACGLAYLLLNRLPLSRQSSPPQATLEWLSRLALAGVFLYAAYEKVIDPFSFASNIYAYRMMPASVSVAMAVTMPMMEVLAAVALLTGLFTRRLDGLFAGAALMLGVMLVVFIVAIFQAILRGIDIHCGCFGKASHSVSFRLILQDVVLLVASLFLLRIGYYRWRSR